MFPSNVSNSISFLLFTCILLSDDLNSYSVRALHTKLHEIFGPGRYLGVIQYLQHLIKSDGELNDIAQTMKVYLPELPDPIHNPGTYTNLEGLIQELRGLDRLFMLIPYSVDEIYVSKIEAKQKPFEPLTNSA